MANLPETPDYPAGVYQLETSDPVVGGPGGIANRQSEQLGNRTAWLKAKIDAFIDGTVAVLKATKLATARTLSISGAGSGSAPFDGSANATIALTLADSGAVAGTYPKVTITAKGIVTGGAALVAADIPSLDWSKINSGKPTTLGGYGITDAAPLDSPSFTGNPICPTPAQFDNDKSAVNSEFVQRALGNFSGAVSYSSASVLLTAADVGKAVVVSVASTVTLPAASSVALGATLFISATGVGDVTLNRSGADTIIRNDAVSGNTFTVRSGTSVRLRQGQGGTSWYVVDGDAALPFSSLFGAGLSANGYQKLPSGLIIQWGSLSAPGSISTNLVITLPITFPVAISGFCAFGVGDNATSAPVSVWRNSQAAGAGITTSSVTVRSNAPAGTLFWLAIGY